MTEKNITPTGNLVQDISNELIFGQKHNDIDCALCPTAKRACDRAWVTAKQIEDWSEMSTMTLNRRLHDLEECERIQSFSDLVKIKIEDNNGRGHETTLYNLNVLNQLAMVEMKNKVLNDTAKKFSDILSEVETTGSYGVTQISRKDQLFLDIIHAESEDARVSALTELNEINKQEVKALQAEHEETKALLAEEREKVETLNEAVDDLTRTKAWINDKKTASAMGTAGAKSKECERLKKEVCKLEMEIDAQMPTIREAMRKEFEEAWITARDWCFKHKLPVYANQPKWVVSERLVGICAAQPDREQWHMNAYGVRLFPQWACAILDKVYDEDDTFLIEYRTV